MINQFNTLAELRAEKMAARNRLNAGAKRIKLDVANNVKPTNTAFYGSHNVFMNYIGYAIMAYKAYNTLRGVTKFFSKSFKKRH